MKVRYFLLIILICILGCSHEKDNIIELPLTMKKGYGPFRPAFGGVSFYRESSNNPWAKTYLQVTGIPADWTEVKIGDIETNMYQTVYQNYLMGNISQEWYDELQRSWNWDPDTLILSKTPLKCKIAFATGKDAEGKIKMVVDTNNNRDFSDDKVFSPMRMDFSNNEDRDSITRNAIKVSFERLSDNEIIEDNVPLLIVYNSAYDMYMNNFPQYAIANLGREEIAVCSNNFTEPSYKRTGIVRLNDSLLNGKKADPEKIVKDDEYLVINEKVYKNKGVNRNKNVLVLEPADLPQNQLYSTQTGFKTLPFEGQDFKTKEALSLDTYKGKYLLIDFWAVWCGPCIEELPNLKTLYEKMDKTKMEILGIVGNSPDDGLEKIMEQYAITWPQILSDGADDIIKKYRINSYPTTLLVDPDGVIIARDLRGRQLEDKIDELMAQ